MEKVGNSFIQTSSYNREVAVFLHWFKLSHSVKKLRTESYFPCQYFDSVFKLFGFLITVSEKANCAVEIKAGENC